MTTRSIFVLDPTAKPNVAEREIANRLTQLNGKRIGFLDNAKPNIDIFLARVEEVLADRYRFAGVVRRRKAAATDAAAQDIIEELAAGCDLVINGVGD